jgi:hypothetical protein
MIKQQLKMDLAKVINRFGIAKDFFQLSGNSG